MSALLDLADNWLSLTRVGLIVFTDNTTLSGCTNGSASPSKAPCDGSPSVRAAGWTRT
jgi:hypothetical protein